MKESNNWNDFFKPPFVNSYNCYIFDSNNQMCFDFVPEETNDNTKTLTQLYNDIITVINGGDAKINGHWTCSDEHLWLDGKPILEIRGWGYLNGALKIHFNRAIEVQNSLIEYVYNKLKKNENNNRN